MAQTTDRRTRGGLDRAGLIERFRSVRSRTLALVDPLSPEDMVVQLFEHTSPTKWHLAHTTWFFETFVLEAFEDGFAPYSEPFRVLFNSYYVQVGDRHPRARRGALTRPGLGEVMAYRAVVDERIAALLVRCTDAVFEEAAPLVALGLQHEEQHQELAVTDALLTLWQNPIAPAYDPRERPSPPDPGPAGWIGFGGGIAEIGHDGDGFAYDNEGPRHRRFLEPFELADRPITAGEYLEFVEDAGYRRPELWLDEGWATLTREGWRHPLYWRRDPEAGWLEFSVDGLRPLDVHRAMTQLGFFEAEAFARWSGARLPTECEWEHACAGEPVAGNFASPGGLRPEGASRDAGGFRQAFGDVWEWTRSAHEPYPGYAPPPGAVGEYNGKFMCGQFVLRGGSCATAPGHVRSTYRNFFPPSLRWQFAGVRLARSAV